MTVRARALGSRYQLEDELGTGAMGTVWRARDLSTGEAVAAKLLHDHFAADVAIVTRFLQERTFLTQLDHPNIVRVRDLVVEGRQLGIVMDLVEGSDARNLLREEQTLTPERAAQITADVLDGLAHAHALRVLHRDIKPDNVLLDGDRARLSDFSIARLAQETTVKMTGLLGTADYMAPEVFNEEVSTASDVYGAGILLYELLAGRTPFGGSTNSYAVARRHETTLPPVLPGLPDRLWILLAGMLAKAPSQRPTAGEASAELRRLLPDLAGIASMPRQETPSTWDEIAQPSGSVSVRSALPPMHDTEGTYIGERSAPAAEAMPVQGSAPVAVPTDIPDAPLTQLGEAAPQRPVLDVPDRQLYEAPKKPISLWVKAGVAAGVVALVAGGIVVATSLGGSHKTTTTTRTSGTTAAAAITADSDDEPHVTGLTIQRSATYDAATHLATVTLTYKSGQDLTGPFLESIPSVSADDARCPRVAWSTPLRGVTPDVSITNGKACAVSVPVGALGPRGSDAEATYVASVDLKGDDPTTALRAWLDRAATLRTDALSKLSNVPDFAAQRLTGLTVDVLKPPTQHQAISFAVRPQWLAATGAAPDNIDLVFSSDAGDGALLAQLGGHAAFHMRAQGCEESLQITPTGSVVARGPNSGCGLVAQVGAVSSDVADFSIANGS